MKISLKMSRKLRKLVDTNFDISRPLDRALTKVSLTVQNSAKRNAPFDTGSLRRSITSDLWAVNKWMVVVGSPLPYAKRRHYENFRNPSTKRYLERAYTENKGKIRQIIHKALSDAL